MRRRPMCEFIIQIVGKQMHYCESDLSTFQQRRKSPDRDSLGKIPSSRALGIFIKHPEPTSRKAGMDLGALLQSG